MFERLPPGVFPPEVLAQVQVWWSAQRESTPESTDCLDRVRAAARIENQAAAAQLVAIGELFAHRWAQSQNAEDWAIDTMEAVAGEVAAGLRIGQRFAFTKVSDARTLRERLPQVGAVFAAGDIGFLQFRTIAQRTDLIEDPDILARVDALIATNVTRWPSLTRGRLSGKVDAIVAHADRDAVRQRTKDKHTDRQISVGDDRDGLSTIWGTLLTPDAHALTQRLSALADTVCPHDPRTSTQRRADALGALAAGADRLGCRCARTDCAAGTRRPASPVTIHVIADQSALRGDSCGWEVGADGLITPELIEELAKSAALVPLRHPGYHDPEPHYTPSAALAAFVRCRDLTCRWPGCDVPAAHCDLDHTIPYHQDGPTHAGNLKCYCKTHHLMKTFWGWTERQLADGTLILTSPAGATHVTLPGSALLFPSLCYSVGGIPTPETDTPPPPSERECTNRTAAMPRRRRTRTQDRTARVTTERNHNRQTRTARPPQVAGTAEHAQHPPPDPDEPPPF